MKVKANNYQGAGNDFVIIDNRKGENSLSKRNYFFMRQRFGIGGDGSNAFGKQ